VQLRNQLIDVRVHDRLSHEGQRAMGHGEGLLPPLGLDAGDALEDVDHVLVFLDRLLDDHGRVVHRPSPLPAHGVLEGGKEGRRKGRVRGRYCALVVLDVGGREGGREGGGEGGADRAVAPAKHASVGASKGRCHLHTLVGGNAIECVLVAPAATTQLVLRPAARREGEGGDGSIGGRK